MGTDTERGAEISRGEDESAASMGRDGDHRTSGAAIVLRGFRSSRRF